MVVVAFVICPHLYTAQVICVENIFYSIIMDNSPILEVNI